MRILLVADHFPPDSGGLATHVQRLAESLVANDHEVMVLAVGHEESLDDTNGFVVRRCRPALDRLPRAYQEGSPVYHPPAPDPSFRHSAREAVRLFSPDVAHVHGWSVFSIASLPDGLRPPIVCTLHDHGLACPKKSLMRFGDECATGRGVPCLGCDSDAQPTGRRVALASALAANVPWMRRRIHHFLAVSGHVARRAAQSGLDAHDVSVVPNFIDLPQRNGRAEAPTDAPYVLYAGPDAPHKGRQHAIDAFERLDDGDLKLVMVGGNGKANGSSSIVDLGWQQGAALTGAYRSAEAVVVPSVWPDPCPTVALEAMAWGRPVVASDTGGLPEIVRHGETGLLVPPGDSDALADALRALMSDEDRREAMGRRAERHVRAFSTDTVLPRIESIYESATLGTEVEAPQPSLPTWLPPLGPPPGPNAAPDEPHPEPESSIEAAEPDAEPAVAPLKRGLLYSLFPLAACAFAAAYLRSRLGHEAGVHELFWLGVALAVGGASAIAAVLRPGRWEGLALSGMLGVVFYLPKLFRTVDGFAFYDELSHARATGDLLRGGGLFAENPINRVVESYPGLHAVAAGLASVTGTSLFTAGNILIFVAHALVLCALFLAFERVLGTPRRALVGVLIYAANPAFLFFDSYFAYESLALPLAVLVITLALVLPSPQRRHEVGTIAVLGLLVASVVVTHHITTYALAAILGLFALLGAPHRSRFAILAGLAAGGAVGWLLLAAPYTIDYLRPYVDNNVGAIPGLVGGHKAPRELFAGAEMPFYEVVGSYAAVVILGLAYLAGVWRWWRDEQLRKDRTALALVILGAAYFLSLPLVLIQADQVAKRSWEFSFIGLAAICALSFAALLFSSRPLRRVAAMAGLFVLFLGGVTSRTGDHLLFPGSYAPNAGPRSDTSDVEAASAWMLETQGPDNHLVGDRTTVETFGYRGRQHPASDQTGARAWRVFFPHRVDDGVISELERDRARFVVVDERTAEETSRAGWYFSESEPGAPRRTPLATSSLSKFATDPHFALAYDNGNIRVYRFLGVRS